MADLKLKRLVIRNWMKFKHVDMTFPEKGLVLVQGINSASGGALSSVGSGKTALGEAICRTLLGTDGRFSSMKQISLDKAGDTYVRLEADLLGKPLVVEAGYDCDEMGSNGEALRYSYGGGKPKERGRMQQTRDDLAKLLGVPPLLAGWTAFIDGEKLKFNKLKQSDCVDLVMSALRQPPWNEYFEAAKKKCGEFRREMASTQATHQAALSSVNRAKSDLDEGEDDLTSAQKAYDAAVASHNEQEKALQDKLKRQNARIVEIGDDMAAIKCKLKVMEDDRAEKSHKAEIAIHDAEDLIQEKAADEDPLRQKRDHASSLYTEAKSDYNNYKKSADKCPTCQRPMGELDPARLADLEQLRDKAKAIFDKADAKLGAVTEKLREMRAEVRRLRQEHEACSDRASIVKLSDEYAEAEDEQNEVRNRTQRTFLELSSMKSGPSDTALTEAKTTVKGYKRQLATCEEALSKAAALMAQDAATIKVMDYWYNAYSPYGIPNMVLREAIGPLNREARRVSAALTGGTIEVKFSTIKEMASGQEKAQLNIEVDNKIGDKDLAGSSKGEAGLSNFVISETLSEVGQISRRLGFRWLDEVLPNQDPKVCQSIYRYLKDVAERLGILIFLVDHNPTAANYADHTLIVEKESVIPTQEADMHHGKVTSVVRWR